MITNKITIFIISDSAGGTANSVAKGAIAQFPDVECRIRSFPFIREIDEVQRVVEKAEIEQAIILHTFADKKIVHHLKTMCNNKNVFTFDVLSPITTEISTRLNIEPSETVGAMHKLDQNYFDRIEAMEFAVTYDDGKDPKGFLEADILLLGISRTSKTPLSMYLANQNYKVANLPLLPENNLPDELWEVDSSKIIGLTNDEGILKNIREERMRSYGLDPNTPYSSYERIKRELDYAEELYNKIGCKVINVASKSIEETAAIIMNSLDE